jgi:VanZ family protein
MGGTAAARWRLALGLLIVAVSYLALTPKPPEGVDTGWDKLAHALAFTALAFAGSLSYPISRRMRNRMWCGLFVFGGVIEVVQLYVPGRSMELGDLLADSIGIACGAAFAALDVRALLLDDAPILPWFRDLAVRAALGNANTRIIEVRAIFKPGGRWSYLGKQGDVGALSFEFAVANV